MTHSENAPARLAAQHRYRANKRQKNKQNKREAKARKKFVNSLPQITEDNLLAFQSAHFGDDTKPNEWFVETAKALNFEPEYEDIDDGLGYYDDGVKRTLTDEEIAVFRRSELWQMKRDQEIARPAPQDAAVDVNTKQVERVPSPASEVSSLEDELLAYASLARGNPSPAAIPKEGQESESRRSKSTSNSTESWKRRRSKQEVPYYKRNKRKWEHHILEKDAIEGSLTHRRLARELDDQQEESIDMDY